MGGAEWWRGQGATEHGAGTAWQAGRRGRSSPGRRPAQEGRKVSFYVED